MAVVKNITPDRLHLFSPDAPPIEAGDEVTLSDERFVGRAWPKSTWKLVKPPVGYSDASTDDAHLWVAPEPEPESADATEAEAEPKKAGRS